MSKIVGPFEPMELPEGWQAPADAQWWRFHLRANSEGFLYEVECDDSRTWLSWEFFDGESAVIDCGLDRPTLARLREIDLPMTPSSLDELPGVGGVIDVLHVGPPSPPPYWEALTEPGRHKHPEDGMPDMTLPRQPGSGPVSGLDIR